MNLPEFFSKLNKSQKGFTLIELLLVVSIIGVLSGVLVSIINVPRQQAIADDSVRIGNIRNVLGGLNIHRATEGTWPDDANNNGNPVDDSTALSNYMTSWPQTAPYFYASNDDDLGCVSVPMATDPARFFKYFNSGGSCAGEILRDCSNACATGSLSDQAGCVLLDESSC